MNAVSLFAAKIIASATLLAGIVLPAAAGEILATGQGWCNASSCNNTNTAALGNTYAGAGYHDWFAFNLSSLQGQQVTGASIHIFNHSWNTAPNNALFSLYQASAINYAGLVSNIVLGTVKGSAADKNFDHYVHIQLNAEGLKALNAKAGQSIVFGGAATAGEFFGYTNGQERAFLKLDSKAVPEPANVALFGLGLLAFIGARRRKQK